MTLAGPKRRLLFLLLLLALAWPLSLKLAASVERTDFPAFYWAARATLDPQLDAAAVYGPIRFAEEADVEPFNDDLYFIYGLPVARLLSPLGLLPYQQAKALFITLNILAYFASVALLLRAVERPPAPATFVPAACCLWVPFLNNLAGAQSNGLILLLASLAALALSRGRPLAGGGLLGAAALFKIAPLVAAGIAGARLLRVPAAALLVFLASFALPGALAWPRALALHPGRTDLVGYTPAWRWLADGHPAWFGLFVLFVVGLSAVAVRRATRGDALYPLALGLAAALLAMPVVEYHHFLLLTVPVIYLGFSGEPAGRPRRRLFLLAFPVILLNLSPLLPGPFPFSFLALAGLWLLLLFSGAGPTFTRTSGS